MECYEGVTMIKTFRGLLAQDAQDTIVLHTNDGSTGYRITKFQIMNKEAGASAAEMESTVKIYKVTQTPPSGSLVDAEIDFSDNTLLGAAQLGTHASFGTYAQSTIIIFDKETFNQDIYVTHKNLHSDNAPINYYIELEQLKLDLSESTVATLKDLRNEAATI